MVTQRKRKVGTAVYRAQVKTATVGLSVVPERWHLLRRVRAYRNQASHEARKILAAEVRAMRRAGVAFPVPPAGGICTTHPHGVCTTSPRGMVMTTPARSGILRAGTYLNEGDTMVDTAPKNRPADDGGLGPVEITVTYADGRGSFDPNDLIVAVFEGWFDKLKPVDGVVSDISGAPAFIYRTSEIELNITRDELVRMVKRNLRPSEFFALLKKYGDFFEIHSDFYNFRTGIAEQPKG